MKQSRFETLLPDEQVAMPYCGMETTGLILSLPRA